MAELISGYKRYAKSIIESRSDSLKNYKLVRARASSLSVDVVAGGYCPRIYGSQKTRWQRIPNLDFDKDSYVYFYCCDCESSGIYKYVVINAITNEEKPRLVEVRYDYKGG